MTISVAARAEMAEMARKINTSPVWNWPTAPCPRCGKPSRLTGAAGGGDCISCMLEDRGHDHFDMNAMHQPIEEDL